MPHISESQQVNYTAYNPDSASKSYYDSITSGPADTTAYVIANSNNNTKSFVNKEWGKKGPGVNVNGNVHTIYSGNIVGCRSFAYG